MRRQFSVLLLLLVVVGAGSVRAGVTLVLGDDQQLRGKSVEFKDGLYVLELESGDLLPLPAELVQKIELTGNDAPPASGIKVGPARTLVGPPEFELPRPAEQRRVLAASTSRWSRGVFDPVWRPSSDWTLDPSQNNFHPVRWYKSPIDPNWTPISAFKAAGDVTEFHPVRWYQAPIDPIWFPTDGFRRD